MKLSLGFGLSLLLSLSSYAQDYESVMKRLKQSVEVGEISERQAWLMMSALKQSNSPEARLEQYGRGLKRAVKAGKLTEDQAWKKWKAAEEKLKRGKKSDGPNWDQIKKRVEGAVKRGDMTREQADQKYAEIEKQWKQKAKPKAKLKINWEQVKKEVEAAVKAGKITREQADKKYEALKKREQRQQKSNEMEGSFQYFPNKNKGAASGKRFELEVTSKAIELGGSEITLEQISMLLEEWELDKKSPIFLNVHFEVSFEKMEAVMDILKASGYKNIAVSAQEKKPAQLMNGGIGYGDGRQKSDR